MLIANATVTWLSWTEEMVRSIAKNLIFVDPSRQTWLSIGESKTRIRDSSVIRSGVS